MILNFCISGAHWKSSDENLKHLLKRKCTYTFQRLNAETSLSYSIWFPGPWQLSLYLLGYWKFPLKNVITIKQSPKDVGHGLSETLL